MRAAVIALCTLALAAAVVVGVRQARDTAGASPAAALTLAQVSKPIAEAPPQLAALHRRVNELDRAIARRSTRRCARCAAARSS